MSDVIDMIDKFCETAFEELGIPTPKKFTEARVYVNHQFPDLLSRQSFLGTMTIEMCEEFGIDKNELLDFWKEVL